LTAFLHEVGGDGAVDGVVVNGSGIGNESLVPASAIVQLLAQAHTDAKRHPLLEGLARPGQTGTLKGRLLDSGAEGVFAGKTGTGEGALALSGVAGGLLMSLLVDQMKSKRDDVRAVLDASAIVLCTLG
jgi:D-alanyl-D-alanine carboxypeptidase